MDIMCYYKVLNVHVTATQTEIKRAFRAEALLYHPDKVEEGKREDATKRFQLINEAFRCGL